MHGHLFLIGGIFICLSLWYYKPKYSILSILGLLGMGFLIQDLWSAEGLSKTFFMHLTLDMLLIGIHLLILQAFKHLKFVPILIGVFCLSLALGHNKIKEVMTLSISGASPELIMNFDTEEVKQSFLKKYENEIVSIQSAFYLEDESITDLEDYQVIDLLDKIDPYKFIKAVSSTGGIDWIEYNQIIEEPILDEQVYELSQTAQAFNDPFSSEQWSLSALKVKSMHEKLKAKKLKAKKEVTIAILDTGIDAKHEDITSRYKSSGTRSYDTDTKGHGTHCAGIAAAVTNNKKGVASVIPEDITVNVMSIKVLSGVGFGTQQTIINGILKAADLGADVISLSLGGMSTEARERAYKKAVKYANDKGAIVVVAAGNSARSAKNYSPANTEGVIAVTAIGNDLKLANFANFVDDLEMGIAAPGVEILSTFPKNEYKKFNGTSMAAPYVAGIIGIIKAYHPDYDTKQIYQLMTDGSFTAGQSSVPIVMPEKIADAIQ